MKSTLLLIALTLIGLSRANALSAQISECRTAIDSRPRITHELIAKGLLAVDSNGEQIDLQDILADEAIFFLLPNGKISENYQWMYNTINPVQNRADKFLSSSYGEDVIITLTQNDDQSLLVEYVGTVTGKYLSLLCK
jgi:hypothetical protein